MNKNTLKDIFAIVMLMTTIGIVYNYFNTKKIPWFKEKPIAVKNNSLDSLENALKNKIGSNNPIIIQNKETSKVIDTTNKKTSNQKLQNNIKENKLETKKESKSEKIEISSNEPWSRDMVLAFLNTHTVTYLQVKQKMSNTNYFFIDARSAEDYAKSHIGNSINIYPYWEQNIYMEKIFTLPRDKIFIIYCTGGDCELSHHVSEDLIASGRRNLFIYTGGWEDWNKQEHLESK